MLPIPRSFLVASTKCQAGAIFESQDKDKGKEINYQSRRTDATSGSKQLDPSAILLQDWWSRVTSVMREYCISPSNLELHFRTKIGY